MIRTGLVSVTFRKLSAGAIVGRVAAAGLDGIEWGGDVHVPHGDLATAADVARMTVDAGLVTACYGSYYIAGTRRTNAARGGRSVDFRTVLATALALGAPMVRVWPGHTGSEASVPDQRLRVIEDLRRIAAEAAEAGVAVVTEYHGNTLTDTPQSARAMLAAVEHENLRTYWQRAVGIGDAEAAAAMEAVLPRLTGLHVFNWDIGTAVRQPLAVAETFWTDRLADMHRAAVGDERWALLEFVRDDSPDAFAEDAETLLRMTANAHRRQAT